MRGLFYQLMFLMLLISSCTGEQEDQENALPAFSIENQEFDTNLNKASFIISLDKRVSEQEIEQIAKHIKEREPGFGRYYIMYYLPDMDRHTGAWATSHYDPELTVRILGASDEEEKTMLNTTLPEGKIIGKWLDNRAYVENTMIIYEHNGKLKLRQIFKDGSFGDEELKKQGNKYIYENDFGEYLKIEADNHLGLYSENGRFATAKRVE